MVELLAQHEGDAALKQYCRKCKKNMLTGWTVLKTCKPTTGKTRCKTSGWYPSQPLLDDRDTPRPESWVEDIATAKSIRIDLPLKFTATCALPLRLAGFQLALDGQPASTKYLTHHRIVPVDLNSLMFKMEKILARPAKLPEITRWQTSTKRWQMPSKRDRKIHVERSTRLVCRLHLKSHKVRNQLTAAALFPLYSMRQRKIAPTKWRRRRKHICATRRPEHHVGEKWATMGCANGWAPLQWVATEGLQNYGQKRWRWTLAGTS